MFQILKLNSVFSLSFQTLELLISKTFDHLLLLLKAKLESNDQEQLLLKPFLMLFSEIARTSVIFRPVSVGLNGVGEQLPRSCFAVGGHHAGCRRATMAAGELEPSPNLHNRCPEHVGEVEWSV